MWHSLDIRVTVINLTQQIVENAMSHYFLSWAEWRETFWSGTFNCQLYTYGLT